MTKEKTTKALNLWVSEEAEKALGAEIRMTGKSIRTVIEDHLLGRRQFRREIEQYLDEYTAASGYTRRQIIEAAIIAYSNSRVKEIEQQQVQLEVERVSTSPASQTPAPGDAGPLQSPGTGKKSGAKFRHRVRGRGHK